MPCAIRPMTADDWPAVAAIYAAGMKTGNATFETRCPTYADWDRDHLPAHRLVALCGDNVAGWAALSPYSRRAVYRGVAEVSLYVDPAYGRQGIGHALLCALCDACDAAGLWTLQSGILRENEASLRLHARCGFRVVGTRERLGQDRHGRWRDVILMERRNGTC